MDHRDALALLRNASIGQGAPQHWADLGCGAGTFTRALADLLPPGSSITAIDRDASVLSQVPSEFGTTRIAKHVGDFTSGPLPFTDLDGILLANALHFVREQPEFVRRASSSLRSNGAFLLVEYDTDSANPWVPHPLSFTTLAQVFKDCGFRTVIRLAERPSVFGRASLYSAWVER